MSEVKQGDLKNYNTGDILTPFQKVGQQWDKPMGQWIAKAAAWRQGFFISVLISIGLLVIFLLLLFGPQQSVFVVSTTKNGFVKQVAVLKRHYYVTQQQYQEFLSSYLKLAIGVALNHETNKQSEQFVRWFSAPEVVKHLQTIAPQKTAQGSQRLVKLSAVTPLGHAQYRVVWQQAMLAPGQGKPKHWQHQQAVLTVVRGVPQTEAQVRANPLGFYVTAWHNETRGQHGATTSTK